MTPTSNESQPLSTRLTAPIEVGEPDVAETLAVFPLFGPIAVLDYVALADPAAQATITEMESGASVNDLLVHNAGTRPVLLYEGEEILGAQQNRVLDVSILVAAESKTRIPVSCVEQGRWDGRRHGERFVPSPQTADPRLRKLKNKRARMNVAAGLDARADQSEVWEEVAARGAELDASSATGAMSDIYETHRDGLGKLREGISLRDGQTGSVAVIDGRIEMLDYVGRPEVYAVLHHAIVEGYALDALAAQRREVDAYVAVEAVDVSTVRGFTLLACDSCPSSRTRGPGMGSTARFADSGVEGSALVAHGEVVQMTAFPSDGDDGPGPGGRASRVNRPSRRRR